MMIQYQSIHINEANQDNHLVDSNVDQLIVIH